MEDDWIGWLEKGVEATVVVLSGSLEEFCFSWEVWILYQPPVLEPPVEVRFLALSVEMPRWLMISMLPGFCCS